MRSKLLTAALGGLLLLGSGLAMADDGGRGRYDRGGQHGWHDRGWNDGPRWGHSHRYHGRGHGQWKHGHRWGHRDHRWHDRPRYHRGHYGYHGKRYAGRGDDITIIFRGSLD